MPVTASETPATVSATPNLVACELADLLISGTTGLRLMAELRQRFPHANRSDVFFGVAMAISLLEAERIELLYELQVAESRIPALTSSRAYG
jgi:hypothetical protein